MSALETFFEAWSITDAAARHAKVAGACTDGVIYSDPRSDGRLSGLNAVADYVGMFSANAPGWTAKVVFSDQVNGYAKAVVAFGGQGPDGAEMVQHGTYFADLDDAGKLVMLAGFVGGGQ